MRRRRVKNHSHEFFIWDNFDASTESIKSIMLIMIIAKTHKFSAFSYIEAFDCPSRSLSTLQCSLFLFSINLWKFYATTFIYFLLSVKWQRGREGQQGIEFAYFFFFCFCGNKNMYFFLMFREEKSFMFYE